MEYLEILPIKVVSNGEEFFLRIKRRESDRKWIIKYVGKRTDKKLYTIASKVRGFSYKTNYQAFGKNLEALCKKTLRDLSANQPQ